MLEQEAVARIADPGILDEAVDEVFGTMLGLRCGPGTQQGLGSGTTVSAVVGFGGVLSGACILRSLDTTARKLAGRMTGLEFAEIDATVLDGIGELCNMLAGTWKRQIPELAAQCALSVPAVITGQDYNLHVQAPTFEMRNVYQAEDVEFEVRIVCDRLER